MKSKWIPADKRSKLDARKQSEQYRRRRNTFLRRANEMNRLYGVEMAVFMKRNKRFSIYLSKRAPDWPPSKQDLVGTNSPISYNSILTHI